MNIILNINDTIIDALKALNENPNLLTAFVVDNENRLIGTITDGDIRRYVISGGKLEDGLSLAVHKDCATVKENSTTLLVELKKYRNLNINVVPCIDDDGHIVRIYDLKSYKSHLPIDAVLMAGGKGERLRPLTEKVPKPLVKVGDKCIIDYNIDRLIEFGVKRINVTVNYLKEQLHEHFVEPRNGIKVNTIEEPKFLGTIGSIRFIKEFYNDTVLVMNSDLFTNIDYEDFYLHFCQHDADMSVAAVPYVVKVPYGVFSLDGRDIKGVVEKPTYSYYANAGIYLIKKHCLDLIPKDKFFNATDFMDRLIATHHKVVRYPISGFWIDIGQHDELARAREMVKHIVGF